MNLVTTYHINRLDQWKCLLQRPCLIKMLWRERCKLFLLSIDINNAKNNYAKQMQGVNCIKYSMTWTWIKETEKSEAKAIVTVKRLRSHSMYWYCYSYREQQVNSLLIEPVFVHCLTMKPSKPTERWHYTQGFQLQVHVPASVYSKNLHLSVVTRTDQHLW